MGITDKEVLELCKAWFEDIMERSDRLTSGNVSHGSRAIRGVSKNYAEFIAEHLKDRWVPSEEQITALRVAIGDEQGSDCCKELRNLLKDLKKLKDTK
jgi:hypothetical protein